MILSVLFLASGVSAAEQWVPDGTYEVQVKLLHVEKDRPSMGSRGMADTAELVVKNGKGILYITVFPIKEESLETSIINCYLLNGNTYERVARKDWNLELSDVKGKRPSIFEIPVNHKDDKLRVLVDPQVIFMGGVALPARLGIDWDTLKRIDKSKLAERADKGEEPSLSDELWLSASGISAGVASNTVKSIPDFTVGTVLPDEVRKLEAQAGVSGGKAWEISLNEPMLTVSKDKEYDIQSLRKPLNHIKMNLLLPRTEGVTSAKLYVFAFDGTMSSMDLSAESKYWRGEGVPSGKLLLIEGVNGAAGETEIKGSDVKVDNQTSGIVMNGSMSDTNLLPALPKSSMPILSGLPKIKKSKSVSALPANGAPAATAATVAEGRITADGEGAAAATAFAKEKERPGIIATVIVIFLGLIAGGVSVCKRQMPMVMNEIWRYKYLKHFERTVLK